MIRAFISAPLDEKTRAELGRLDREQLDIRWSQPEQWHITIQFFDHVNLDELQRRFARIEAFQATGVLGPRITRLGARNLVVPVDGLSTLANRVRESMRSLAPKDQLPFVGHVTLGRIRDNSVPVALEGVPVQGEFQVGHLMLMKSFIGSEGARHTVIDSKQLFPEDGSTCHGYI